MTCAASDAMEAAIARARARLGSSACWMGSPIACVRLPQDATIGTAFSFPTSINLASVKVILDAPAPLRLEIAGISPAEEAAGPAGGRRLIAQRDFLKEMISPPQRLDIRVVKEDVPR